jgi:proliferating cell nuclear antigen
MFSARIAPRVPFKVVVDVLKSFAKVCNFVATPDGIRVTTMDASQVALCVMHLNASGFEAYECSQPDTVGINLVSLATLLKRVRVTTALSLETTNDGQAIDVALRGPKQMNQTASTEASFRVPLVHVDTETVDAPDAKYTVVATLSSVDFQTVCRDLGAVGDKCVLTMDASGIQMHTLGDIQGRAQIVAADLTSLALAPTGGPDVPETPASAKATGTFALRYLQLFTKATKLAPDVTLSMTTGEPLCVEYVQPGFGPLRYHLAPKTDDADGAHVEKTDG